MLTALEESAFVYWLSTSMLGIPTFMALHSVGMGIVVGLSLIITLRMHRVFAGFALQLIPRLLKVAAWGFLLNFLTGIGIFITRGPDYLGSGLFLFKMLLVVVSGVALLVLQHRLTSQPEAHVPQQPNPGSQTHAEQQTNPERQANIERHSSTRQNADYEATVDKTARVLSLVATTALFAAVVAGRLLAYLSDLY